MKRKFIYAFTVLTTASLLIQSCTKDLDLEPKYGQNTASVYNDPDNYIHVLAKMYAGLVLSGLEGPAGNPDIAGIDEGFSPYLRVFWNMQELPTDEVKCAWSDVGIPELNSMQWTSNNSFVKAMYSRLFFQITMANEFIRESSETSMDRREFDASTKELLTTYRSEARFLRAFSWVHAIDLFGGNVPFMTEENGIGSFQPEQTNASELFAYVESELLEIEPTMVDARANEYGRADKAAAWFLLAHMYLNAESWTGTSRYDDCITYLDKIISAGYTLEDNYLDLFLADNDMTNEAIFSSTCDAEFTQSYGGTTFLVHSCVGGEMDPDEFGIGGGWAGNRTTWAFAQKFLSDSATSERFQLFTDTDTNAIGTLSSYTQGWGITKWRNMVQGDSGLIQAPNYSLNSQANNDFHWMRLGEAYLMYAECAVRGSGNMATAIGYVNELRDRANEPNVTSIDLDFILDERGRELQFEGKRRTDLIRFGKFTSGDYVWEFKGGSEAGSAVGDHLNLYPLSSDDVIANPNLTQNPGY